MGHPLAPREIEGAIIGLRHRNFNSCPAILTHSSRPPARINDLPWKPEGRRRIVSAATLTDPEVTPIIVLYWMTPDPIVVTEDTTLLQVLELHKKHRVRRFPVIRGDDEVCGIVARTDLYRHIPQRIVGDDIPDHVAQILGEKLARDVMTPDPETCEAYEHIEDVCRKFCDTKVGAMPVLNRGHLVGVISESDLLRALTELSYRGKRGKRVTLRLPAHSEEVLYSIVDLCRRYRLELRAVLTHPILDESRMMATLRVDGDHLDGFVKALWDKGYNVVEVK